MRSLHTVTKMTQYSFAYFITKIYVNQNKQTLLFEKKNAVKTRFCRLQKVDGKDCSFKGYLRGFFLKYMQRDLLVRNDRLQISFLSTTNLVVW